jgi:hypothetical protein
MLAWSAAPSRRHRQAAMPRVFVGNFDFEHRLACGGGTLPRNVEQVNTSLCPVWAAVADEGDAVWVPAPIDPAVFHRLAGFGLPRLLPVADPGALPAWYEATFWGGNEWAAVSASRWCLRWEGCDPRVVRRVNSRRFQHDHERRLGVLPTGAEIAVTPEEFAVAVARLADVGWVAKGEFGGAGREVRFGAGPPAPPDLAWAANRFRRGLAVTVEPRLERLDEAGLQFRIGRGGEVDFDGITPLLTRPAGGYLGSSFAEDPLLTQIWRDAIEVGLQVAEAVAAEGYFGPLGIDAMRHLDTDGSVRIRPLQDLNARYTMGRLALGLRRFPQPADACDRIFRPENFRATAPTAPPSNRRDADADPAVSAGTAQRLTCRS